MTDSPPKGPGEDRNDGRDSRRKPLFRLGDIHWDRFLKRYVWDDETTPYLVPAARLTRRQADSEFKAYAIFLGFLFGVAAVITLSASAPGGRSPGMSLFSFTIVCGAVLLATTRHPWAALYVGAAPVGTLLWLYVFAEHPKLSPVDDLVIVVFALLWIRYGLRIVAISRLYDSMPEGSDPPGTRRHFGRKR